MSDKDKLKLLSRITKSISSELGRAIGTRPYLTIVDRAGTIHYRDESEFKEFGTYLGDFTRMNFNMLNVGDHSIPLSGKNLVFFKVSDNLMIILFTKKGLVGQLLGYKSDLFQHTHEIQEIIGEVVAVEPATPSVGAATGAAKPGITVTEGLPKVYPRLSKPIKEKERFLIDQMAVLRYCDGNHDIISIAEETGLDVHTVYSILDDFESKKRIQLAVEGAVKEYVPMYIKPIPPLAMELGLITPRELEISKLCDGNHTVNQMIEELSAKGSELTTEDLDEILEKMMKKKYIKLRVKVT